VSQKALLGALGLLAALHVGVLAYHLGLTLAFPYDLNYGEGYVLNDAVRLSRGESLYIDLQQFPMVRSPYPPLFPLVWSAFQPLTGPAFWPGRLLSVLSLLGIGAVVAWNAWRVRCGIWPAVATVGLVAASPFVYQWAGYARVDMLALLCAVGGVVTAQWIGGWRGVIVSAVLCGLAVWTKQTTVTAAVAVGIAYTLRSWRYSEEKLKLVVNHANRTSGFAPGEAEGALVLLRRFLGTPQPLQQLREPEGQLALQDGRP